MEPIDIWRDASVITESACYMWSRFSHVRGIWEKLIVVLGNLGSHMVHEMLEV